MTTPPTLDEITSKADMPKILMLGWEFPPVINGGLGVACHDLCIALSTYADVTMMTPTSNPDFVVKNLNLIGRNTIDAKTLRNIGHTDTYKKVKQVHFIDTHLNPYYNGGVSPHHDLQNLSSQYLKTVK
ncbi:MAG: glycogen/starch synthase [Bacteroidetes bacterium]|nr:glycogen/starch synthase [Bacteroidota bacterium]